MPPARRTPPPVDPAPLLAQVWTATVTALADEPDPQRAAMLSTALARQLTETRERLATPATGPGTITLETYLRDTEVGSADASMAVPVDLEPALRAALARLADSGPSVVASPAGPIERRVLLEERLLRAVALGRRLTDPLIPARPVLRLCVRLLARVLAERAPGRTVELRVPPHVAVQCIEGPRHNRGTPPNVVEAEPIAFLDVAVGCGDWMESVTSGRIRASGERADLRPWLPLLGR